MAAREQPFSSCSLRLEFARQSSQRRGIAYSAVGHVAATASNSARFTLVKRWTYSGAFRWAHATTVESKRNPAWQPPCPCPRERGGGTDTTFVIVKFRRPVCHLASISIYDDALKTATASCRQAGLLAQVAPTNDLAACVGNRHSKYFRHLTHQAWRCLPPPSKKAWLVQSPFQVESDADNLCV